MEQDQVLEALRADLADLTALHGVSGCEHPVVARLRALFAPLVSDLSIDHMGNLAATIPGPADAPHVVVCAHSDEIGAVVATIEPDGFLRLYPIGGVQARLLEGRAVSVARQSGVIGARGAPDAARRAGAGRHVPGPLCRSGRRRCGRRAAPGRARRRPGGGGL